MSLTTLSEWLRCPICLCPLTPIPPLVLGCDQGHRFDANKAGYVSLLSSQPRIAGDTGSMLDARARLLDSGAYDPLIAAIADSALTASSTLHPDARVRVVDVGSGTGHYSAGIGARLSSPTSAGILATDIAADAVRRSVRRIGREHADGLVADTWQPLPIRTGAADIVIDVFAPRNPGEFRRILADDGRLVVATPQRDHLVELRRAMPMLDVPADKAERVAADLSEFFVLERLDPVRHTLDVTPETALALRSMGPSGHHALAGAPTRLPDRVTVAVDVLRFRPREPEAASA
jgi:23S rRNA (guanine745-N1)-methyltransferase